MDRLSNTDQYFGESDLYSKRLQGVKQGYIGGFFSVIKEKNDDERKLGGNVLQLFAYRMPYTVPVLVYA
jgi:hypothetical protein